MDRGCIFFAFVSAVVKNLNSPNWSSMADVAITQSGIGVLGSPFYTCGSTRILGHDKQKMFYGRTDLPSRVGQSGVFVLFVCLLGCLFVCFFCLFVSLFVCLIGC